MKLKLHTSRVEPLTNTLSLISQARRVVALRFTTTILYIIAINDSAYAQEPQTWCKLRMDRIFDAVEIQSVRDNTIMLEVNVEMLLQSLRHHEKSNSDGLHLRLQRKDTSGTVGATTENGRSASLALFYSSVNANSSTINHTFKIPVKILKANHEALLLKEPELQAVDLMIDLPNSFVSTYKRLDKFRKASNNDIVTIKASRRNGGFLGFVLEDDAKFKVTISWIERLDVRKPATSNYDPDSMNNEAFILRNDETVDESDSTEDKELTVRLRDWKMASKIVATCKTVILLIADREACVLHCLLDDTDDVEVVFFLNATRIRDED